MLKDWLTNSINLEYKTDSIKADFDSEEILRDQKDFEENPFNVKDYIDTGISMNEVPFKFQKDYELLELPELSVLPELDPRINLSIDQSEDKVMADFSDRKEETSSIYRPGINATRSDVINKSIIRVIKRFYGDLFYNGYSKIYNINSPVATNGMKKIDEVSF